MHVRSIVRILGINNDAQRAYVKFEIRLDVFEHDVPWKPHHPSGRMQLKQFVWAQAVPGQRVIVFEKLARREREHLIVVWGHLCGVRRLLSGFFSSGRGSKALIRHLAPAHLSGGLWNAEFRLFFV